MFTELVNPSELVGLIWNSILIHLCNCSSGEPGSAGRPTRHSAIYNRNGVFLHLFFHIFFETFFHHILAWFTMEWSPGVGKKRHLWLD